MTSEDEMFIRYYTLYGIKMKHLKFANTWGQPVEPDTNAIPFVYSWIEYVLGDSHGLMKLLLEAREQ